MKETQLETTDKLDTILATITRLDTIIDTVTIDLNLLRTNQRKTMDRVKKLELEVTVRKPQAEELQGQLSELTKRVGFLEYRAENSEGRARRNNIRLVGLPEKN